MSPLVHVISAWNGFTTDLAGNPYYNPAEAFDAATSYLKTACCRECAAKVKSEVVADRRRAGRRYPDHGEAGRG